MKRGARRTVRAPWLVVMLAAGMLSCLTTAHGTWHVMQPGENLYRIAHFYGVSVAEILEVNDLGDVADLRVGTELWIPGVSSDRMPQGRLVPPPEVLRELQRAESGTSRAPGAFAWPVAGGKLTSRYGPRWGRMHEGIDIGVRSGTPVTSAADGRVIFASRMRGYGNVVIVKHGSGLATVYAHNRKNRVRKGAQVRRGDVIAEVGQSGNANGPNLHFEVRQNDRPLDPLRYLP